MSYTIQLLQNPNILELKAIGAIDIHAVRKWASELEKIFSEKKIQRFLFDVREAKNTMDIVESFNFANVELKKFSHSLNARSAMLANEIDRSHNIIETVFQNAGHNSKRFTDRTAAIKWLEEGL